jgi:TonB family protein
VRLGQGGSGSGGGQGAGAGARQGNAVALPVPGGGGAAEYDGYYALVRTRVHEILKYPSVARRRGLTGHVEIEIDIAPTGVIVEAALVVSSSHPLLDDAALEAARAVGRVPFPPGVQPRPLRMRLPVVFVLR